MSKKLRNDIVKHLQKKGSYEPDVDDYLIDMIISTMHYADEAKSDLDSNGVIVSRSNGNGVITTKMNPAFGILQMCERQIHQTASKLGLNRKDRLLLKLVEVKEQDALDDIIDNSL